jgi:DNA-binding PadR family transcriptional regulator
MRPQPDVSSLLPLTPRVFLILWALEERPQHGYRLLKMAEELGRGRVSIGPASLYESIAALEKRDLIERTVEPQGVDREDKRRRYFQLTDRGREVLKAEANRVARLAVDLREAGLVDSGGRS